MGFDHVMTPKEDLAKRYRKHKGPGDGIDHRLAARDLVVNPMPESPRPRPTEPRVIPTPCYSINY
jgi:hypothetical protein